MMKQVQQEDIFSVIHFTKEVWHQLFPILTKLYNIAPLVNVFLYFGFFPLASITLLITEKVNINELEVNSFPPTLTLRNESKHLTSNWIDLDYLFFFFLFFL